MRYVRLEALDAELPERRLTSASNAVECRKLRIITGLKTLSSKFPIDPRP